MSKKETKKINWIYLILILLIVVCVGIIIALLVKNEKTLTPDFAPGTIDTNAIMEESSGSKEDKKPMEFMVFPSIGAPSLLLFLTNPLLYFIIIFLYLSSQGLHLAYYVSI